MPQKSLFKYEKKLYFNIKKPKKSKKPIEMITQNSYYCVFYDISKPKTYAYAMQKRVEERTWLNLVDNMPNKSVELRTTEDSPLVRYDIISHVTFHVYNTVDNCMYAVFECRKTKQHNLYPTHRNDNLTIKNLKEKS